MSFYWLGIVKLENVFKLIQSNCYEIIKKII